MPVVLFYSGLYRSTSVSDVHLITLRICCKLPESVPGCSSQDEGDLEMFLGSMPIHRVLCLASVLLSQPYVMWDICKKSNQGGLFFQLRGSNSQFEDPSYLFDTITIFLKVAFRNSNSWRFSCHKEP